VIAGSVTCRRSCFLVWWAFFFFFFFHGFLRELIENFYIRGGEKKRKKNISIKFSVQYRSFRFKQFSLFMARLIFTQGAGMHDCGHKARVSPHKIKIQLSPMAYHREERFRRGGKWDTQLYSQVIPEESRGNYVVLQNENLNWEFYNSENRLLLFFFFFVFLFYFIPFLFKEDWQCFFSLEDKIHYKIQLGKRWFITKRTGNILTKWINDNFPEDQF